MLQSYNSTNGQSIYDVCLMTYGSLDYLSKLIIDNGYGSADNYPGNKIFIWDDSLIVDSVAYNQMQQSMAVMATAKGLFQLATNQSNQNQSSFIYCLSVGDGSFLVDTYYSFAIEKF